MQTRTDLIKNPTLSSNQSGFGLSLTLNAKTNVRTATEQRESARANQPQNKTYDFVGIAG